MNDPTTHAPDSTGAPGCLSDLALDRALATDDGASLAPHVDTCPRCAARLATLRTLRDRDAVRALAIARRAVDAHAPWRSRARFAWPALAGALAAVAMVVVAPSRLDDEAPAASTRDAPAVDVGVRAKGVALRVFVKRDGEVREASSSDRFRAGDALRLELSAPGKRHVMVVGVNERGALTVYHPFGGDASTPLGASAPHVLPGSLVLDDARETETLVVVAHDAPFSRRDLEGTLAPEALRSTSLDSERLRALSWGGEVAFFEVRRE